jgi:cyanophycinase
MILIGGSEDKCGERVVLSEIAKPVGSGKLVVATLASEEPLKQWETYRTVFGELGLTRIEHLSIESREQAGDPALLRTVEAATCIFFTGGDQLRITTKLGGTPLLLRVRALYEQRHLFLAGTSAGASAMGETMLVSSPNKQQIHKVKSAFIMAPGLGFVREMLIDQHFAQRARIERLVGAVAENPGVLGIGIDEDTAIRIEDDDTFTTIGSGAVYVADGSELSYTNVSEKTSERTLSLFDLRLHVLDREKSFDLRTRRPRRLAAE